MNFLHSNLFQWGIEIVLKKFVHNMSSNPFTELGAIGFWDALKGFSSIVVGYRMDFGAVIFPKTWFLDEQGIF